MVQRRSELYAVYKRSEGGMGQKMAIDLLKLRGIDAERAHVPYIGMSGVLVYGDERVQRRAQKILY